MCINTASVVIAYSDKATAFILYMIAPTKVRKIL